MDLREDCGGTEREQAENETQSADHSLSTKEPARSADGRLMYYEHQLQHDPYYVGYLDETGITLDEGRALLPELFDRFNVHGYPGFPLPPAGLPGFLHSGYSHDDLAAKMIEIGIGYAKAVVHNERRAMHLRWQDAESLVRKIESAAEDAVYLAQAERAMREYESKDATPQFVYFIGAESGPIKIGVATKPPQRLRELQTSHHERLSILATCEGDMEVEKAYHKRFADHRLSGEWFKRVPEIEAEIEKLTDAPKL